jgi:hypothetical protein
MDIKANESVRVVARETKEKYVRRGKKKKICKETKANDSVRVVAENVTAVRVQLACAEIIISNQYIICL